MAGSVNKVILIGNLGKDPEVRQMQSGGKVCNLSIATSESWTDKQSGERREKTEWHRVVVFNERLAEVAEKYLAKGRKVYVEGQLQTRKWTDQQGQDHYATEIVLSAFNSQLQILDKAPDGPAGDASRNPPAARATPRSGPAARPSSRQPVDTSDLDDDIPF